MYIKFTFENFRTENRTGVFTKLVKVGSAKIYVSSVASTRLFKTERDKRSIARCKAIAPTLTKDLDEYVKCSKSERIEKGYLLVGTKAGVNIRFALYSIYYSFQTGRSGCKSNQCYYNAEFYQILYSLQFCTSEQN